MMKERVIALKRLIQVVVYTLAKLAQFRVGGLFQSAPERRRYAVKLLSEWGRNCARIIHLEIRVEGTPPSLPTVCISNHRSYLDIVVLAAVRPCLFLAKQEIGRWPIFGPAARAAGCVFVDRDDRDGRKRALASVAERMHAGLSLVVFPEGTTSAGPAVLPFRPGTFQLCHEQNFNLTPIGIDYSCPSLAWIDDDTFVGHFMRTQARNGNGVMVRFGDTVRPRRYTSAEEVKDIVYAQVISLTAPHEDLCQAA